MCLQKCLPKWYSLRAFGSNRVIQSSYFWFIFVPIAAKALLNIKKALTSTVLAQFINDIDWNLPFSWQLFYFSAVSFTIANIVYFLFCPEFIKTFKSFQHFRESGGQSTVLKASFLQLIWKNPDVYTLKNGVFYHIEKFLELCDIKESYRIEMKEEIYSNPAKVYAGCAQQEIKNKKTPEFFWLVRTIAKDSVVWARGLCAFFYASGFVLILTVISQKFWYVFKLTFLSK